MVVFVSRKPIFDKNQDVLAYELPFQCRHDPDENDGGEPLALEEQQAAGFLALNIEEFLSGKDALVQITPDQLTEPIPEPLNQKSRLMLCVDAEAASNGLLSRCRELHNLGYDIVLDNFTPTLVDSDVLEDVAEVRMDFLKSPLERQREVCRKLMTRDIPVIATNVHTPDHFEKAMSCGYSLVQGEFFARPNFKKHVSREKMSGGKLTCLQVLREIQNPDMKYDEIEILIKQDVAITYRLLKFINSAWFGLRHEIQSIKRALVMLGPSNIKKWISLFMLRYTGSDKPSELLQRSLTRARTAEQLAALIGMSAHEGEMFLMGMFSVIDALTDTPMQNVLAELPLTKDVKAALLGEDGKFSPVYNTILAYEQGNWDAYCALAEAINLDPAVLPRHYRFATIWATKAMERL